MESSTWPELYLKPEQESGVRQRVAETEAHELLAHISRSETESQQAYQSVERQLRALARRLDATERIQSENSRATSGAATQINIAAREQAQAFDRLAANVTGLADRLAKVERQANSDSLREAVKALHDGLSRLADQVGHTAGHSASQLAVVAGTIESLGGRLESSQNDSAQIAQDLDWRVTALSERIGVAEKAVRASASALEGTMQTIQKLMTATEPRSGDFERDIARLAGLRKQVERLETQIATAEANSRAALARLDDLSANAGAKASAEQLAGRFQNIESELSSIMIRLDGIEHGQGQGAEIHKTLGELAVHLESADKLNREAIAELKAASAETLRKTAELEEALEAATSPPHVIFDAPPFANSPASARETEIFSPPAAQADRSPDEMRNGGGAFATAVSPDLSSKDYLASARRSARATAFEDERNASLQRDAFVWPFGTPPASQAQSNRGGTRYAVAAVIVLAGVMAALAGTMLSRGLGSPVRSERPTPQRIATASDRAGPVDTSRRKTLVPDRTQAKKAPANGATPDRKDLAAAAVPSAAPPLAHQTAAPHTPSAQSQKGPIAAKKDSGLSAAAKPIAQASSRLRVVERPVQQPQSATTAANAPAQSLASRAGEGNSKAELALGLEYLEGDGVSVNEAEAARWLTRAALQGEAVAQYRLATMYDHGRGLPADAAQAAHWYELAAKQGNRKAMHDLAVAYADGSGKPKDYAQAALWFGRAAALGLTDSQFNLGVLYERGMGIKQSLVDAYKWYAIAAAQGDSEAKARLDVIGAQLSQADRTAAQQAATAFKAGPLDPTANSAGSSSGL